MMKNAFLPLAIILLSLLLSSCEIFMEEPQAGKVYAILVALDYDGLNQSTLHGTIPDAVQQDEAFAALVGDEKFEGYLFIQEKGGIVDTKAINGTPIQLYPTIKNIEEAISALSGITTADDLVLFTFSGHAKGGNIALAPNSGSAIETYEVSRLLDGFSSVKGRKLIILDACETGYGVPSDPASSSTLMEKAIASWYAKYFNGERSVKSDLFVMTSSATTDSYEDIFNGKLHGVFTYALLKALGWNVDTGTMSTTIPPAAKRGRLTVDGLLSYIKTHQTLKTKRSLFKPFGDIQHPMVSGGALDMILFTF